MERSTLCLRRIDAARFDAVSVVSDAKQGLVDVRVRKVMKPDDARRLAVELFYMADEAEGGPDVNMGSFGYQEDDSRKLGELRSLIDEHLGWEDDAQEIDGDYEARVVQVGKILKRRLVLVKT